MVDLQMCTIQIWFMFSVVIVTLSMESTYSSRTGPQCVDQDTNCPLYKNLMCNSSDEKTKIFAIQNCPVTCNLCKEFQANIQITEVFSCFGSNCTTPKVCQVYVKNNVPVSGSCVDVQKNSKICGPFPTNGTCDCYNDKCMSVIDMLYSIHNTTVPWKQCVDHDSRCKTLKNQICYASAPEHTKKFAIKTCPRTCNYCAQYSELLHPTPKTISCFSSSCTTPQQVCRVNFVNSVPISASCIQKQQKIHICSLFPTKGYCECDSAVCMSKIITYLLASIQVQPTKPTTTHMVTTSATSTNVQTATHTTTHEPITKPTTTQVQTTTPTSIRTTVPTTSREQTTTFSATHEPTNSPYTTNLQRTTPTTPVVFASIPDIVTNPTKLFTTTQVPRETASSVQKTSITSTTQFFSSVSASQNVNNQATCNDSPGVNCTVLMVTNICSTAVANTLCARSCNHCPPCEDKTELDCSLFVASNICDVPTAKIYCAKTCKHCSSVQVVNGPPIG
ncbi:mucin-5AC-like [Mytilus trossulus]|uniref:mucin-5AC-like n=1 Tax=Mytilus trossulus TaxID=6551 RepID=UPI0030060F69